MVLGKLFLTSSKCWNWLLIRDSDAFAGGFMAGVVQGKSLDTCIDLGQWLAKLSIKELGPSYPFPKQTYTSS
jgi:sugar/nucleoside kinase (ribokinase family)